MCIRDRFPDIPFLMGDMKDLTRVTAANLRKSGEDVGEKTLVPFLIGLAAVFRASLAVPSI
eukprot:3304177-Prorocentrum_lima.AAC.1